MSSGPMMALCLAREEAVDNWRGLLGPKEVEELEKEKQEFLAGQEGQDKQATEGDEGAKNEEENKEEQSEGQNEEDTSAGELRKAPLVSKQLSLRAEFQVEGSPLNPLHGSDSAASAEKEIGFIFPVQTTVAVIKPDAEEEKDEIVGKIKEAGFKILSDREVHLSKELASQFYHEHESKEFYGDLTDHMTSGKTTVMVLQKEDAVSEWRSMMGPTDPEEAKEQAPESIRALYGKDKLMNAVHGSSDTQKAEGIIKEFFPDLEFNPDGSIKESSQEDQPAETTEEEQTGETEGEKTEEAETKPEEGGEEQTETTEGAKEEDKAEEEVKAEEGDSSEPAEETKPEGEEPRADEPQVGDKPDDKPVEEGDKTDDKPVEEGDKTDDKPVEEGAKTDDKPTEEGGGETGDVAATEGESKVSEGDAPPEGGSEETKPEEGGAEVAKSEEVGGDETKPEEDKPADS